MQAIKIYFLLINSVISVSDYIIIASDYIISGGDFIIGVTDYRINAKGNKICPLSVIF